MIRFSSDNQGSIDRQIRPAWSVLVGFGPWIPSGNHDIGDKYWILVTK